MEKLLFDTSVWINYNRNIVNSQTEILDLYINFHQKLMYTTPTIVQEYLMGIRTIAEYNEAKEEFLCLNILSDKWLDNSIASAKLYFDLRKKGVTIRKSTDCLIASIAIENNILLVHNDFDFELIEKNSDLRTF